MNHETAENTAIVLMWLGVFITTYIIGTRFGFSLRTDFWFLPFAYVLLLWGLFAAFYTKILDKTTNFLIKIF